MRALFLNILLDFRDKLGISCIFITHNLATAYYLGGDIMVMCRGRVIEHGTMDAVVNTPQHPYTQLLLESVPNNDPRKRWPQSRKAQAIDTSELKFSPNACVFVARCPHVMDICHQHRPALMPTTSGQAAACFLYGDKLFPVEQTVKSGLTE